MSHLAPWVTASTPELPTPPLGHTPLAVGLDVQSLEKLAAVLLRSPRLYSRVCAEEERLEWTGGEGGALAWSAALWVTKEASVKCLGTGFWRQGVDWPDLNVGGVRAQALDRVEVTCRSEEQVWERWRDWREVTVNQVISGQLGGRKIMCCARREARVAWGFAYLVAPDHH